MAAAPVPVNATPALRDPFVGGPPSLYKGAMERRHPHRRARAGHAPRSPAERRPESLWIYGFHPVVAALKNPRRDIRRILATPNAAKRIADGGIAFPAQPEPATPRDLDRLLGAEAVHQGVALEAAPLPEIGLDDLTDPRLLVVLDQVTDPHNVGAIFRSAAAFSADAVVTTLRHSPVESGVLAKAASGALDLVPHVAVPNLARALAEIGERGFVRIGLDADAGETLEAVRPAAKIALVLGAEGKGLRQLTQDSCDVLARLPVSGALGSLNVSNAAVLALYLARRLLSPMEPEARSGS
jgi:23S rRNA (guanosine2251-2'-O)-methyltransferase